MTLAYSLRTYGSSSIAAAVAVSSFVVCVEGSVWSLNLFGPEHRLGVSSDLLTLVLCIASGYDTGEDTASLVDAWCHPDVSVVVVLDCACTTDHGCSREG